MGDSSKGVVKHMKSEIQGAGTPRFHFYFRRLAILSFAIFLTYAAPCSAAAADDIQQANEDSRRGIKEAKRLVKNGNLDEAEKLLRGNIEQSPQNTASRLELAYVLLKQGKTGEAANISFEIAKADPKNSFALAILGTSLLNAGNLREANALFITSLTLNKKEALAWGGLGMIDFYENRIDDSIDNLYTAGYYDPDDADFVINLAQVLARDERYGEAADAYSRFLQISPSIGADRRSLIRGMVNFLRYLGDQKSLYDLEGPRQTLVKFELVKERPIIELRVNGREKPLRFVIDTGSGISVISKTTAEQLGIKPVARGGMARVIGGMGKFDVVYGFLKSVQIGDIRVKNVPVYIRDFIPNTDAIDGHVGLSLISKFLTAIDYRNQTFSLIKREAADNADFAGNKDLSLILRRTASGFPSIEVQLDGVEGSWNFIIDSSAGISIVSDKFAELIEIGRYLSEEKIRVIGAGGAIGDVQPFLLPRIVLGSFSDNSLERITAIALNLDSINEVSGFQQSGILGSNFLKNYRLTFDFKDSKVIFTPFN